MWLLANKQLTNLKGLSVAYIYIYIYIYIHTYIYTYVYFVQRGRGSASTSADFPQLVSIIKLSSGECVKCVQIAYLTSVEC